MLNANHQPDDHTPGPGPGLGNEHGPGPDDDVDSALGADEPLDALNNEDDDLVSTVSLRSSILRYRHENGRTYHAYKDGRYVLPNDAAEQDRLDLQHHLFLLTLDNRLHLCPAGPLRRALDIGTGTGIWAVDLADEHPAASVVGVDLSPIQSPWVPPNLSFHVGDVEEPWTFREPFDLIYSRMMTGALADWPGFFRRAYDHLTPGGWLEVADILPITSDDGTLVEGSATREWLARLVEAMRLLGRPINGAALYREQMLAEGFVNVTQTVFRWPQNKWPRDRKLKELGKCLAFRADSMLTR
jgi:SAM-dependent methyltransferase